MRPRGQIINQIDNLASDNLSDKEHREFRANCDFYYKVILDICSKTGTPSPYELGERPFNHYYSKLNMTYKSLLNVATKMKKVWPILGLLKPCPMPKPWHGTDYHRKE